MQRIKIKIGSKHQKPFSHDVLGICLCCKTHFCLEFRDDPPHKALPSARGAMCEKRLRGPGQEFFQKASGVIQTREEKILCALIGEHPFSVVFCKILVLDF